MDVRALAVVGGGPVGLAAAIMFAKDGNLVTIYEKRAAYTRTRIVMLKPRALPHVPGVKSKMRICDLEELLKKEAIGHGVKFQEKEIMNVQRLNEPFIIIATGSNSALRDEIFGPPEHLTKPKRVVECRYIAVNVPKRQDAISYYKTLKVLSGVAVETVSGNTVILLWEPPPAFTNDDILDKMRFWVNIRIATNEDVIEPGTLRYSVHFSTLYRCKSFAIKQKNNKTSQEIYVVGDAAVGVPYFQSLQFGLENLIYLEKFIGNPVGYNSAMDAISTFQTSGMLSVSVSLDFAGMFLAISHRVPWQMVKWSNDVIYAYSKKPVGF